MSFNKKQAKQIVTELEKTHHQTGFHLAAYVRINAETHQHGLTHCHQAKLNFKHETIKSVFETFRQQKPSGQYLLIVLCGLDQPASHSKETPIKYALAKLRGTFRPARLAEVLKLDTNWLDKAFAYQKRRVY